MLCTKYRMPMMPLSPQPLAPRLSAGATDRPAPMLRLGGSLLAISLLIGLAAGCTSPRPTWQQQTYSKKIGTSPAGSRLRQATPEELSPDDEVHDLRQGYADAVAAELSAHLLFNYQDDSTAGIAFLKKERFECREDGYVECTNTTRVYPSTKDPLAAFTQGPTHCLNWLVRLKQDDQNIEDLAVSSVYTLCD